MLEEDLGSKEEVVGCGGLNALLVAGKGAIKNISDGEEEAKDGGDKDMAT